MAWPMLTPAPVVTAHAAVFRDLFENQCQFRPFPHDLTGLLVWPHKRLAHRARCLLDSADNTTLARLLAEAPWREEAVNRRRVRFMLQQTTPQRSRRRASLVVIDATRCDQVGSLVDAVDRPDHHRDGPYPLAHHPVTRVSVSGPVRCPLGRRLSRRDAELRPWEAAVATQVPELQIPTESTARNRRQTQVAPVLLQDPEGRARHEPWRTTSALALEWIAEAIRRQGPWGVVVFEAWYLAADVVQVLARRGGRTGAAGSTPTACWKRPASTCRMPMAGRGRCQAPISRPRSSCR